MTAGSHPDDKSSGRATGTTLRRAYRIGVAIIQGNDAAERALADVEGSPDTHVALRYQVLKPVSGAVSTWPVISDQKIEALYGYGVVCDDWSILESQSSRKVIRLYEPIMDLLAAVLYAQSQVGKPYSVLSVLGAAIAIPWGWLFGRRHNIFGGWNCSRLVMRSLQAAGYPGAMSYDSGGATPAQIDALLSKNHEPIWH